VEVNALFRPDAAPWIRARRALTVCEQGRAAGAGNRKARCGQERV
jgi:hypothetical protein